MSLFFEAMEPLNQVASRFVRRDEDAVDRLNHRYSAVIFATLALIVTTNQYAGELIKCLTPAEYPESWIEYVHAMCWISNTYYIPMEEKNVLEAPRHVIVYYQWVPLLLLLQAAIFYIPGVIWFLYNRSTGLDINKIVSTVRAAELINPDSRGKVVKFVAKHMDKAIECSKNMPHGSCQGCKRALSRIGLVFGRKYGNYLTAVYFFIKLLHIGSMVAQIYMLNVFLGTSYTFYGFEVLRDLGTSGEIQESTKFPRITLCDFFVRKLGRDATISVQCTLPINLFNEKVFTFIWFYLAAFFFINVFSFLTWVSTAFPQTRVTFVKRYLKVFDKYDRRREGDKYKLMAFCDKYLKMDGYLALQMIRSNTNEVIVGELTSSLWDKFIYRYDVGKFSRSSVNTPTTV